MFNPIPTMNFNLGLMHKDIQGTWGKDDCSECSPWLGYKDGFAPTFSQTVQVWSDLTCCRLEVFKAFSILNLPHLIEQRFLNLIRCESLGSYAAHTCDLKLEKLRLYSISRHAWTNELRGWSSGFWILRLDKCCAKAVYIWPVPCTSIP